MTKPRPTTSALKTPAALKPPVPGKYFEGVESPGIALPASAWARFWFTPTDPIGLHGLRVLAGLLFLFWLLPLAGHAGPLFGAAGWFDLQAYREFGGVIRQLMGRTPVNWSLLYLFGSDATLPEVFYWVSLGVLVLYTLGVFPRLTAVLTWVIVGSFVANPAVQEDADLLLPILSLYLMLGYVLMGQRSPGRPLLWRLLGPAWPFGRAAREEPFWRQPSVAANVALRLVQVHFAVVMLVSVLHKLQFGDWWDGWALWYPLHPAFETSVGDVLALRPSAGSYFFFLSLAGYAGLAWQLAFPLFAWRPGWARVVLLGGALAGCLSMAFVYGLPLFGPALVVFCLAYLTPAEWHRLAAPLSRLSGLVRRGPAAAGPARRGVPANASALATPR